MKNRGLADILIAIVDGLKGFPEAIQTVFPETSVQTCIVHLVRHSLSFGTWKDRKTVTSGRIYRAETEAAARQLDEFDAAWGARYPSIANCYPDRIS